MTNSRNAKRDILVRYGIVGAEDGVYKHFTPAQKIELLMARLWPATGSGKYQFKDSELTAMREKSKKRLRNLLESVFCF